MSWFAIHEICPGLLHPRQSISFAWLFFSLIINVGSYCFWLLGYRYPIISFSLSKRSCTTAIWAKIWRLFPRSFAWCFRLLLLLLFLFNNLFSWFTVIVQAILFGNIGHYLRRYPISEGRSQLFLAWELLYRLLFPKNLIVLQIPGV